ncbi:hypothetical protein F4677DRAFT_335492 [Hypoxylon crocopeplum]|nr:hypothetical protein F4677DRAFT_335492 [Hypoxylon crocopeplum]
MDYPASMVPTSPEYSADGTWNTFFFGSGNNHLFPAWREKFCERNDPRCERCVVYRQECSFTASGLCGFCQQRGYQCNRPPPPQGGLTFPPMLAIPQPQPQPPAQAGGLTFPAMIGNPHPPPPPPPAQASATFGGLGGVSGPSSQPGAQNSGPAFQGWPPELQPATHDAKGPVVRCTNCARWSRVSPCDADPSTPPGLGCSYCKARDLPCRWANTLLAPRPDGDIRPLACDRCATEPSVSLSSCSFHAWTVHARRLGYSRCVQCVGAGQRCSHAGLEVGDYDSIAGSGHTHFDVTRHLPAPRDRPPHQQEREANPVPTYVPSFAPGYVHIDNLRHLPRLEEMGLLVCENCLRSCEKRDVWTAKQRCNVNPSNPTGCRRCARNGLICVLNNQALPATFDDTTTHRWDECDNCTQNGRNCDRKRPCDSCFELNEECSGKKFGCFWRDSPGDNLPYYYQKLGYGPGGIHDLPFGQRRPIGRLQMPHDYHLQWQPNAAGQQGFQAPQVPQVLQGPAPGPSQQGMGGNVQPAPNPNSPGFILGSPGFNNPGSPGFNNPGSPGFNNPGSPGFNNPGSPGFNNTGSPGFNNTGSPPYAPRSPGFYFSDSPPYAPGSPGSPLHPGSPHHGSPSQFLGSRTPHRGHVPSPLGPGGQPAAPSLVPSYASSSPFSSLGSYPGSPQSPEHDYITRFPPGHSTPFSTGSIGSPLSQASDGTVYRRLNMQQTLARVEAGNFRIDEFMQNNRLNNILACWILNDDENVIINNLSNGDTDAYANVWAATQDLVRDAAHLIPLYTIRQRLRADLLGHVSIDNSLIARDIREYLEWRHAQSEQPILEEVRGIIPDGTDANYATRLSPGAAPFRNVTLHPRIRPASPGPARALYPEENADLVSVYNNSNEWPPGHANIIDLTRLVRPRPAHPNPVPNPILGSIPLVRLKQHYPTMECLATLENGQRCSKPTIGCCEDMQHITAGMPICDDCERASRERFAQEYMNICTGLRAYACSSCAGLYAAGPGAYARSGCRVWGFEPGAGGVMPQLPLPRAAWADAGGFQGPPLPITGCGCATKLLNRRICSPHRLSYLIKLRFVAQQFETYLSQAFGRPHLCPFCNDASGVNAFNFQGQHGGQYLPKVWICKACHDVVVARDPNTTGPVAGAFGALINMTNAPNFSGNVFEYPVPPPHPFPNNFHPTRVEGGFFS